MLTPLKLFIFTPLLLPAPILAHESNFFLHDNNKCCYCSYSGFVLPRAFSPWRHHHAGLLVLAAPPVSTSYCARNFTVSNKRKARERTNSILLGSRLQASWLLEEDEEQEASHTSRGLGKEDLQQQQPAASEESSCCSSSWMSKSSSRTRTLLLAKTKESFKLSDLYFLEAKLQAKCRHWKEVKLLGTDRNTGSYLLELDDRFLSPPPRATAKEYYDDDNEDRTDVMMGAANHISCLDRMDWIAYGIAFGTTGQALVNDVSDYFQRQQEGLDASNQPDKGVSPASLRPSYCSSSMKEQFSLDYICLGHMSQRDYSPQNLLCRISQTIPFPASLHPPSSPPSTMADNQREKTKKSKDPCIRDLILIETPIGVHLAERYPQLSRTSSSTSHIAGTGTSRLQQRQQHPLWENKSEFMKLWAHRPFQYSSAINPVVANILMDLLLDLTLHSSSHGADSSNNKKIKLLDPTVGSGTFLAFATYHGMDVVGYDIQEKCVEGSIQNMRYLLHNDDIRDGNECQQSTSNFQIFVGDSTSTAAAVEGIFGNEMFDCAVTNLPWGQNTEIKHERDNVRILEYTYARLKKNTYCAVVSKHIVADDLESVGFEGIGMTSIPPKGFKLPGSKKRRNNDQRSSTGYNSSSCIITICKKN